MESSSPRTYDFGRYSDLERSTLSALSRPRAHRGDRADSVISRFMGRANRKPRPRGGRPPAGFRPGERVRDYPQLSVRVPPATKLRLGALSVMQSKPQWRIVLESIECLIGSLSASDQRMLNELIKRPR
jgi:predicted DNA-binding protein